MKAYSVYLNHKEIDTVFYSDKGAPSAEEVRQSLINHDGYDDSIEVHKRGTRDWAPDLTK